MMPADNFPDHRALGLASAHPPKPHLTLRVGISGHRPKPQTFPADAFDRVSRQLSETFASIEQALVELKRENRDFYAADKDGAVPYEIRLLFSLAEGAAPIA